MYSLHIWENEKKPESSAKISKSQPGGKRELYVFQERNGDRRFGRRQMRWHGVTGQDGAGPCWSVFKNLNLT